MCTLVHLSELWPTFINLIDNPYTNVPIDDIHVLDVGFYIKTVSDCIRV